MLWVIGTDEAALQHAADACRAHAADVLEVALEASRKLEAGELGGGDKRTPALRIAELLAQSRSLEVAADAFDARRVATAAETPAEEPAEAPLPAPVRRRRAPRRTPAPAPAEDASESTLPVEDVTP